MSEPVSVEVIVPDDDSEDIDSGLTDGVIIGEAAANSEHALSAAESAGESAEVAQETAEIATDISVSNSQDIATITAMQVAQTQAMQAVASQLDRLTTLVTAMAELAAAEPDAPGRVEPPPDVAPQSGHWLDRRVFS